MVTQNDYDSLRRLHETTNKRVTQLEDLVRDLKNKNDILQAEKKQWEQQKPMQAQIIAQQLGNSDNVVRQLQNEIMELRAKLKEK